MMPKSGTGTSGRLLVVGCRLSAAAHQSSVLRLTDPRTNGLQSSDPPPSAAHFPPPRVTPSPHTRSDESGASARLSR